MEPTHYRNCTATPNGFGELEVRSACGMYVACVDTAEEARAAIDDFWGSLNSFNDRAFLAHVEAAKVPAGFDRDMAADYALNNAMEDDVAPEDKFACAVGTFDMYLDDLSSARASGILTEAP